jgi:hypothetical protein
MQVSVQLLAFTAKKSVKERRKKMKNYNQLRESEKGERTRMIDPFNAEGDSGV